MVRKILNIISVIVLVVLIAIVILLFSARLSGKTPSLFGYQIFKVSTGSMEPTLMTGDVIVVHDTPAEDIHVGDIVTYKAKEGAMAGNSITHRVIEGPEIINGVYYFKTRGDLEGAAIDPQISYDQIQGKYVRTLPLIGKLYAFFFTPYGIITFVFLIVALFGYEILTLIMSYRAINEKDDEYYEPPNRKPSKKRVKNKKTHRKRKEKKSSD